MWRSALRGLEPFLSAGYCHCTRCQRRSGTAASANARAEPGSVRIVQGEDDLRAWVPEGGREKVFCVRCGSALLSRDVGSTDHPASGSARSTAPRGPAAIASVRHVRRCVGFLPDDGLPRYPEARPD